MSNKFFEGRVKYRKVDGNGVYKVTTESYIIDALSFSEAESRFTKEMSEYISEEFKIVNIKVTNFVEIHPSDGKDIWFKSKVSLIAYCEESGKEKKSNIYILVQADDAKDAYESTVKIMGNSLGDYSIPMISETKIMDVFPYFEKVDTFGQ